ncbi:MAG: DsbA family oxidoreductase [Chitinophagaceae bacterium]|nr:DsbA family oxidoreductase [Chitinophagaceae bacterium]
MNTEDKLLVEVWSDIVCPFCYIGKRNYESAISQFTYAQDVVLEFRSFQLDPHFVQDHSKRHDLTKSLSEKYRRPVAEIEAMQQQITQTAKAAGLDFHFEKAITFNTFDAHRIIQIAKEKELGNKLVEIFFAGYFTEGKNLGDKNILTREAMDAGLTREEIEKALTDDSYAYKVKQDIQEASNLGISGVPFFVLNDKYGVSGAQPTQVFLDTLMTAHEDWVKSKKPGLKIVAQGESCDADGNCE